MTLTDLIPLLRPWALRMAKQMLRSKARNEAEKELADVLVKTLDIAEKQARGTALPEDYAALLNEMDEAVVAVVLSKHGTGGVNRYRGARDFPQ